MGPATPRSHRTDEESDALDSLRQIVMHLANTDYDPYAWKWVIIATHSGLHGAMILALRSTWPVRILPDKARKEAIQKQHSGQFNFAVYEGKIAPFLTLFRNVQSKSDMQMYLESKPYTPDAQTASNIQELNRLRNELIHYRVISYRRSFARYPPLIRSGLEAIRFLLAESGNVHWHGDGFDERALGYVDAAQRLVAAAESAEQPLSQE